MDRSRHKLTRELGRRPTNQEVSKDSGVECEKVSKMAMIARRSISLEYPVDGTDSDGTLADILGDTRDPEIPDVVDKHFFREQLAKVMKGVLDSREQKVIGLRYGLADGTEYTQTEIARLLKLSRQRISQIEAKALLKLRRNTGCKNLRDFLTKS